MTGKNTYVSGAGQCQECEYLAIEDHFPNGRPPLEKVGVIFGDRETVDRIENEGLRLPEPPAHRAGHLWLPAGL